MSVLTIANQAGSAGKTTTAVTLAALLAEQGRSVRLIDLDGQANATYWLAGTGHQPGSADVLLRQASIDEALAPTQLPTLRLLASDHRLDNESAVELGRQVGGEQRLRQALEDSDVADVTIIDCPGALSVLTVAALVASDRVLTVAQPTVKELAGIAPLMGTIDDVREAYNPKLELVGIVPCIVPPAVGGAIYVQAQELLRQTYGELVTPGVRRASRIPEAYSQQIPISLHSPNEAVTHDYRAVLTWLTEAGAL